MAVKLKVFTCKAFLLCMNFSFVIGMSQLHNMMFGKFLENILLLLGAFFFVLHFASSAGIQWKTLIEIAALLLIGLIALQNSGGATLLKLVLFFSIMQQVDIKEALEGYIWSLLIPFGLIVLLSLLGILDLYYPGEKVAIEFGMQNPNTVPIILFSVIVAYNLEKENDLSGKAITLEMVSCFLLYFFCRARTAGIISIFYLIGIVFFRKIKSIGNIFKPMQYMFLICMGISILFVWFFRSRTSIWILVNNLMSGRLWAWDLYLTRYGIKFWGQRIDLTVAALDNAYLRLLVQYGMLTFFVYLLLFIAISRYAFKNKNMILLLSVIAYELYFMAEFGPILINMCPVLMYEAYLMVNQRKIGEKKW